MAERFRALLRIIRQHHAKAETRLGTHLQIGVFRKRAEGGLGGLEIACPRARSASAKTSIAETWVCVRTGADWSGASSACAATGIDASMVMARNL